jgi:small subunit ribosomal protein S14
MAKTAVINRDRKRRLTVKKYAKKRAELEAIIHGARVSDENRAAARRKLEQLPRDSSPSRLRNRCTLTGRPRGVFRKFGWPQQVARDRDARGNTRRGQGELVTRIAGEVKK